MLLARPTPHGPPLGDGCRHSSAVGLPTFFPFLLSPLPPSLPPPSALPSPRRQAGGSHRSNRLWEIPSSWPHSGGQRNSGVPALRAQLRGCLRAGPGALEGTWWVRWAQRVDTALPGGRRHDPAGLTSHPTPEWHKSRVPESRRLGGGLGLPHLSPGLAPGCHFKDVPERSATPARPQLMETQRHPNGQSGDHLPLRGQERSWGGGRATCREAPRQEASSCWSTLN